MRWGLRGYLCLCDYQSPVLLACSHSTSLNQATPDFSKFYWAYHGLYVCWVFFLSILRYGGPHSKIWKRIYFSDWIYDYELSFAPLWAWLLYPWRIEGLLYYFQHDSTPDRRGWYLDHIHSHRFPHHKALSQWDWICSLSQVSRCLFRCFDRPHRRRQPDIITRVSGRLSSIFGRYTTYFAPYINFKIRWQPINFPGSHSYYILQCNQSTTRIYDRFLLPRHWPPPIQSWIDSRPQTP